MGEHRGARPLKDILARAHRGTLARFARSKVLLAFDYDGTLAPIVAEPACARIPARTRRLLDAVARLYPCVVISGRSRGDVARRLQGIGLLEVVGNHGLEPATAARRGRRLVRLWRSSLERRLPRLPGVVVEDKGLSLAIHYRATSDRKRAREVLSRALEGLPGARLVGGKAVVNLVPAGAVHKGDALERQRLRFGCETAIYLGDDETDEDVFANGEPARLLSIRVGRDPASAARYHLRGRPQVDSLLRRLIAIRTSPARARKE